jgi:hypothetical protein
MIKSKMKMKIDPSVIKKEPPTQFGMTKSLASICANARSVEELTPEVVLVQDRI